MWLRRTAHNAHRAGDRRGLPRPDDDGRPARARHPIPPHL